jgi:hypothetical protein
MHFAADYRIYYKLLAILFIYTRCNDTGTVLVVILILNIIHLFNSNIGTINKLARDMIENNESMTAPV